MQTPSHFLYAELQCKSNFSFLEGASHPEELVEHAHALGYRALALTDECSVAGVVRAHLRARELPFKLLIGAQFLWADAGHLVVIAQNRLGYGALCELITQTRMRASKGHYQLLDEDLRRGLPSCFVLFAPADQAADLHARVAQLADLFSERLRWAYTARRDGWDAQRAQWARAQSQYFALPVVATGDVLMHRRARKPLQDTLTALRHRLSVAQCGHHLRPNAEQHLRKPHDLQALYPDDWRQATVDLADACTFSLDELRYEYPKEIVPPGLSPDRWLRQLTAEGAARRFPAGLPDTVAQQLNHELDLIRDLHYEPYFLTVHDIVVFARSRGILCQGRGSAANSAVCYCLGITEVDPARATLLFERFISRERNEPPDIDVDFEHQRREEVIQYLYQKYGRHRAALAATVISWRPRSALRDVGRALGVDADLIDQVARAYHRWDGGGIQAHLFVELGLDPKSPSIRHWISLSQQLLGFPRHLSQHVGGFVIAQDRLSALVPVENASMPDRSVIQWDKDDLDAMGLLKVDILALGMLSAIRRALGLIGASQGQPDFSMQDIPAEDPATYEMISQGDTLGVFQIESRAQMAMLPRLQPRCFYDLVIEVAIVRPGPIQGGMVHPYLRRRQGLEPVDYPSEAVRSALERTLGVPIFQEQVMQLAILAAGFTPGEADQLRRAMGAWRRRGSLGPFEDKLTQGMLARGYTREFADRVFKQIQGFGEYGFPESHAASFALLVYVSCWIKRHHPAAFLVALLNSQPMGFYAPAQLIRDAKAHGVTVLPIDITQSQWEHTLEGTEKTVRLGLSLVSGLREATIQQVLLARQQAPFENIEDLARRCQMSRRDLALLARADALHALGAHRRQACWEIAAHAPGPPLLATARLNEAPITLAPQTEGEAVIADYTSTGLTLRSHPRALLEPLLAPYRVKSAQELRQYPNGRIARASGLVTHRQQPPTANGVTFITLEDHTGSVNVIVWPQVFTHYRHAILQARLMTVFGTWQSGGPGGKVTHLIAQRVEDHSALLQDLPTRSRDFH